MDAVLKEVLLTPRRLARLVSAVDVLVVVSVTVMLKLPDES